MRSLTENLSARHFHWSFPPSECALSEEEVHVWVADLDQQNLQELAPTLSPEEEKRAARFHFQRDRKHFVAGRGLLRKLLGCYTEISAERLQFSYGKNGKPALANVSGESLNFNLSHSGGLALYAIARNRELGIDLEKLTPCSDMDEIAERCFPPGRTKRAEIFGNSAQGREFFPLLDAQRGAIEMQRQRIFI